MLVTGAVRRQWELSFFCGSGYPGDEEVTAIDLRRRLDGDQAPPPRALIRESGMLTTARFCLVWRFRDKPPQAFNHGMATFQDVPLSFYFPCRTPATSLAVLNRQELSCMDYPPKGSTALSWRRVQRSLFYYGQELLPIQP